MAANTSNTAEMTTNEFHMFSHRWLSQQFHLLNELNSACEEYKERHQQRKDLDYTDQVLENLVLTQLVDRIVRHYEYYYQTKLRCIIHDPVAILLPSWRTMPEAQFVGSWCPRSAFNLVYSMISPSNLSPEQLQQLEELKVNTAKEERSIAKKMAENQRMATEEEMIAHDSALRVRPVLNQEKEGLKIILKTADSLRIKTLKEVIGILSPIQAVNFMMAAAQLHVYF